MTSSPVGALLPSLGRVFASRKRARVPFASALLTISSLSICRSGRLSFALNVMITDWRSDMMPLPAQPLMLPCPLRAPGRACVMIYPTPLSPRTYLHCIYQRAEDLPMLLGVGSRLIQVSHIGERFVTVRLKRTHPQFPGKCQALGQPGLRIAEIAFVETNFSNHP